MKKLEMLPNGDFIDFDEVVSVHFSAEVQKLNVYPSVIVTGRNRTFVSILMIDDPFANRNERAKRLCLEIAERINASREEIK